MNGQITFCLVTSLFGVLININLISGQNAAMTCYEDQHFVNDWDGDMNTIKTDYFFNGQESHHDNHREDRRFKFRYCKPSATAIGPFTGDKSVQLSDTGYDEEWYRSCRDVNGGHAAIHGIKSSHDNHREDRQYQIWCGKLDATKHRLVSCFPTQQLNNYDHDLHYDCPNNGVIRAIWSSHHNHHEDRIFKFECCNIIDIRYDFSSIIGEWKGLHSCAGCGSHQFTKQFGTSSTTTTSITSTYSQSLSTTVSAGFTYKGFSSSVSVTGTISSSISQSMTSAFTTSSSTSITFNCEKTYLYQWVISGSEERSDGVTGTFHTDSSDYLCTNSVSPKCPRGYCSDSDCQTCTAEYNNRGAIGESIGAEVGNYKDDLQVYRPDFDEGGSDDNEGNKYIFQFSSQSMVYAIGGIICLLLVVNILCLGYRYCRGAKTSKYTKVAQYASSDDEMKI